MAIEPCDHPIPDELLEKLKDRDKLGEPKKCPNCLVRDHIAEMKEIQAGIEERGGVFASKTQYLTDSKSMSHKDWMTKWKLAKICFQHQLELLNEFRDKNSLLAEECGVYHALQIWQLEIENCSILPGRSHISNKKERGSKELVTNLAVEDELSLSAQKTQSIWADGEWIMRSKRNSRRPGAILEDRPSFEDVLGSLSWENAAKILSLDEHVSEEMEDVTSRLDQRLNMGSWNLFDATAGVGLDVSMEPEIVVASPPPSLRPSTFELVTPPPGLFHPSRRSAIKGIYPSTSHDIELIKPQASFSKTVTIFSHLTHPSAPTRPNPIEEPHNQHTNAELARRRSQFYRPSSVYRPSTWASQNGSEKTDTSYQTMSWPERERMLDRNDHEDLEIRSGDERRLEFQPAWKSGVTQMMDKLRERRKAKNDYAMDPELEDALMNEEHREEIKQANKQEEFEQKGESGPLEMKGCEFCPSPV